MDHKLLCKTKTVHLLEKNIVSLSFKARQQVLRLQREVQCIKEKINKLNLTHMKNFYSATDLVREIKR